jgi:transposase
MEIRTIGKTVLHLVGVNVRGEVVVRKKCSRLQLLRFTSNLRECLIGIEACGGSHFLGRALREQGARCAADAGPVCQAICEDEQERLHRCRGDCRGRYASKYALRADQDRCPTRPAVIAQSTRTLGRSPHRGNKPDSWLTAGARITVLKGRRHIEQSLPGILEDPDNELSGALRVLLTELRLEMQYLHRQIEESDKLIVRIANELEPCRRLVAIPGIGPVIATAPMAAIGNGAAFRKGRGFAAWLGVVPGEHSTGGKQKLTDTSRRGNKYLRKLFVQGAHTVLQQRIKQVTALSAWLAQLTTRKRIQVAAVAMANKMARMAWAVLSKGEAYRPPSLPQAIAA